ncbi:MAG: flippase-like domain-containing protein [Clostridia bacterium]|nr:flippase-like domain-containing protein [Clostridia bacterium]
MKSGKKQLFNFLFIFGMLVVVLAVGLSGNEFSDAWAALTSMAPLWLFLCIAVWFGYLLTDAWSLHYFLKKQGYPISFPYAVSIALTGIYYSNITPGASGGQPMQVYYLKKRDVPIGIGSSAVTVKFFCYQLMVMVIGTVAWLMYPEFVAQQVGPSMWILVVGYICNSVSVSFVLLMAVNKRLVRFFIQLFIKVGCKLHICKDAEAATQKWEGTLSTFHASVMLLRNRPKELIAQLLISTAQFIFMILVVVCVYHGFGLSGHTFGQLMTLGMMLYISAAYTPLPGASGAQEGVFALYFAGVFPQSHLFVALLIWRFFTYYISLIVGGISSVYSGTSSHKKKAEA